MSLQAIAKTPAGNDPADKLFIGLHGWGANAHDLAALADYIALPGYTLRFPNAPFPHPFNPIGRMWYNFPAQYDFQTAFDFDQQADLQQSRQHLKTWLSHVMEETGIPAQRTVVAGFSQGGAMTMDVCLQFPLAGAIVLSGYLHSEPFPHADMGPVLMVHGRQDSVVPVQRAQMSRDVLQPKLTDLTYREHDMGHEVSPLVLQEVKAFCDRLQNNKAQQ